VGLLPAALVCEEGEEEEKEKKEKTKKS